MAIQLYIALEIVPRVNIAEAQTQHKYILRETKMTPQQIKDSAPEGATHYNPSGKRAIYYKLYKGDLKFYVHEHNLWYGSCMTLDELKPL